MSAKQTEVDSERPRPRKFRWLMYALLAIVAVAGGLWFLPSPETINQPVRLVRDANGTLNYEVAPARQFTFVANAASIESQNSLSTASSVVHSKPDYFADRSISIINLSDHLLAKRAAECMVGLLAEDDTLQQIDYYPPGHSPVHGSKATDLYVMLEMVSVKRSRFGGELQANFSASFGTVPFRSNVSTSDDLSLPTLKFASSINLGHQSSMSGVESSGSEYLLQGKDIGTQLAESIKSQLKDLREDELRLPTLPSEFFPEWTETPDFEFIDRHSATEFLCVNGLCVSNDTFWLISSSEDSQPLIRSIYEELSGSGWIGKWQPTNSFLRMRNDAQVIEVFERKRELFGSPVAISNQSPPQTDVVIHYRRSLSPEARASVYEKMLTMEHPDTERLLDLRKMGTTEQQNRLMQLVQKNWPRSAKSLLSLAETYSEQKDLEKTLEALKAVSCLQSIDPGLLNETKRYQELLDQHKIKRSDIARPDRATIERLGFPFLESGFETAEMFVREGESAAFYTGGKNNKWPVVAITFHGIRDATNKYYEVTTLVGNVDGGRSWSRGLHDYSPEGLNMRKQLGKIPVLINIRSVDTGLAVTLKEE